MAKWTKYDLRILEEQCALGTPYKEIAILLENKFGVDSLRSRAAILGLQNIKNRDRSVRLDCYIPSSLMKTIRRKQNRISRTVTLLIQLGLQKEAEQQKDLES